MKGASLLCTKKKKSNDKPAAEVIQALLLATPAMLHLWQASVQLKSATRPPAFGARASAQQELGEPVLTAVDEAATAQKRRGPVILHFQLCSRLPPPQLLAHPPFSVQGFASLPIVLVSR